MLVFGLLSPFSFLNCLDTAHTGHGDPRFFIVSVMPFLTRYLTWQRKCYCKASKKSLSDHYRPYKRHCAKLFSQGADHVQAFIKNNITPPFYRSQAFWCSYNTDVTARNKKHAILGNLINVSARCTAATRDCNGITRQLRINLWRTATDPSRHIAGYWHPWCGIFKLTTYLLAIAMPCHLISLFYLPTFFCVGQARSAIPLSRNHQLTHGFTGSLKSY